MKTGSPNALRLYSRAARLLTPTPRQNPDEWSLRHRQHPVSSAIPGPRSYEITPYLKPFVRALAAGIGKYSRVVFCCGSQMGKTEATLDVLGERFDTKATSSIYCGPTLDFISTMVEPRIQTMIDETPSLSAKLARGRRLRKNLKIIGGNPLRLAAASSAAGLVSTANSLAILDELDQCILNVDGRGSPLELIEARGYSFGAGAIVGITSTPTKGKVGSYKDENSGLRFWSVGDATAVQSPIWRLWQSGSMFHWAWPCPHCFEYFIPRFANLSWQSAANPHATTPAEARRTAHMVCDHCGGVITDDMKVGLNSRGRYAAPGQSITPDGEVIGPEPDNRTLSFWVSGLCSPFVSFGQRAEAYLSAVREHSQEKVMTVRNSSFGELFDSVGGDAPEWEQVASHRANYKRGESPQPGTLRIILTVDVQRQSIFLLARGYGIDDDGVQKSWLLEYGEIAGDTSQSEIWRGLFNFIHDGYCGYLYDGIFIDSGFNPSGNDDETSDNRNIIYKFVRGFRNGVFATKGASHPFTDGRTYKVGNASGVRMLIFDPNFYKSTVHDAIRSNDGSWLLPNDADADLMKQYLSEAPVRRPSGKIEWVPHSRQNHYLDLEAMNAVGYAYITKCNPGARLRRVPDAPIVSQVPPNTPAPRVKTANTESVLAEDYGDDPNRNQFPEPGSAINPATGKAVGDWFSKGS